MRDIFSAEKLIFFFNEKCFFWHCVPKVEFYTPFLVPKVLFFCIDAKSDRVKLLTLLLYAHRIQNSNILQLKILQKKPTSRIEYQKLLQAKLWYYNFAKLDVLMLKKKLGWKRKHSILYINWHNEWLCLRSLKKERK